MAIVNKMIVNVTMQQRVCGCQLFCARRPYSLFITMMLDSKHLERQWSLTRLSSRRHGGRVKSVGQFTTGNPPAVSIRVLVGPKGTLRQSRPTRYCRRKTYYDVA